MDFNIRHCERGLFDCKDPCIIEHCSSGLLRWLNGQLPSGSSMSLNLIAAQTTVRACVHIVHIFFSCAQWGESARALFAEYSAFLWGCSDRFYLKISELFRKALVSSQRGDANETVVVICWDVVVIETNKPAWEHIFDEALGWNVPQRPVSALLPETNAIWTHALCHADKYSDTHTHTHTHIQIDTQKYKPSQTLKPVYFLCSVLNGPRHGRNLWHVSPYNKFLLNPTQPTRVRGESLT